MEQDKTDRILVVGNDASISRVKLDTGDSSKIDLAETLEEAIEQQASGRYSRIIIDPDSLSDTAFEILPSASMFQETNYSDSLSCLQFTGQINSVNDIIEGICDNFFCLDRDWRFTHVNTEAERQFRKTRNELIGRNIWELFPEAIGTSYWDNYNISMIDRIPVSFESYYPPHDLWTEVHVYPTDTGIAVYCLDISDRKQTEHALAHQSELLQGIIDNIPVLLCIWDANLQRFRFNRHLREVLGYTEEDTLDGNFMSRVYPDPEYRQMVINYMQSLEGGWRDLKTTAKDGSLIDISWANVHLSDDSSIGIGIDIRDRKYAEEALRESEERFRHIFHKTQDAIVLVNDEARYVDANPAAEKVYGVSADELKGRYISEFTEKNFNLDEAWKLFKEIGSYISEDRIVHPDGTVSDVKVTGTADVIPGKHLFVLHDITDSKRTEQALKDSEELFRAIFDASHDAIVIANDDGRYVSANPAVSSVFGLSADEIIGKHVTEFMIPGFDMEKVWSAFIRNGGFRGEHQLVQTDGTVIDADSYSIASILPGYHLSIVRNISERKKAERHQQEVLEREHRIAEVLQNAILPPDVPLELPGYEVAVKYQPALDEAKIGGDFYDIFDIGDGKYGILVADVAGKGLAAAIRVASARHTIRSYAYMDPRPSRVISLANDSLCKSTSNDVNLITAFFAILDTQAGSLSYTIAGHELPIICCANGDCSEFQTSGMPIGIYENITYSQATRRLDPGDTLVVITDGITEAKAPGPVLFGKKKLLQLVQCCHRTAPDEIASCILDAARSHAGGQLQDDVAIMVIRALSRDEV